MVLTKQQVNQILEFMENETLTQVQITELHSNGIGTEMFINNMKPKTEHKDKDITDVSNW